jgi:large subunit ribosomal protein L4
MKLRVFTADGSSSTERDFPIAEFEGDKGRAALKQVIVAYLANKRQGTVSTKRNDTVHGTGKKPFRQKGTGQARQGARNRSQHHGGAIAHGPQPRDWSQTITKRMRHLALSRALFERASAGEIDVIERFEVAQPKTKVINQVLSNIDAGARKLLIVDDAWADTTILAARNLARVHMAEAGDINALDLSKYDRIVLSEAGMSKLLTRVNGETANA